jgi:hypothetical protein
MAAALAHVSIAAAEPRQGHVTTIALSPASPVAPGTSVTVTVSGVAPCGAIEINFGDGADQTFPISGVPFSQAHAYPNTGTFTITAKGQGNCTGQTTASLVVAPPVVQKTDLTVSLQVASPVVTGRSDPAVVTLHNGPVAASGVSVRVTFQGAWTVADSLPAGCVQQSAGFDRTQVLCTAGTMAPGAAQTFRIDSAAPANPPTVRRGAASTVSVEAVVDPANQVSESNENNNTATVDVALERQADLAADGSSLPTTGTVGADLVYPIRVKNLGDAGASNVGVRMFLAKQVDFVRVEGSQIANCVVSHPVPDTAIVNCTAPAVPAGGLVTAQVVTHVINGLVSGDRIDFTLQVDPFNAIPDRDRNNNLVKVTTTLSAAVDLAIAGVTVERRGDVIAAAGGSDKGFGLSCGPDPVATAANANTVVHVQIKNLGPGQATSGTATMAWASGIFPAQGGDCPPGSHCDHRLCTVGAPPANPNLPFAQVNVPAIFPGTTIEVVFYASRTSDPAVLGTVTIDPAHVVNDPNRGNNVAQIR